MRGRLSPEMDRVELPGSISATTTSAKSTRSPWSPAGPHITPPWPGKYAIEALCRIPVEIDVASELRYRDPIIDDRTLAIVISQSGETLDTIVGLREAKSKGAKTIAITNVVGSMAAREADGVLYTYAGPEIAVASTKAYTTQLMVLYLVRCILLRCEAAWTLLRGRRFAKACGNCPDKRRRFLTTPPRSSRRPSVITVSTDSCIWVGA